MVKGIQQTASRASEKYIGFAKVQVRAVNPTRAQYNKMFGLEDSEDDKEIVYLSQDHDGNERVRLSFWLYDQEHDKYFVHSFNLTNKVRLSKDGVKTQFINNTCITAWSDVEENLPVWFTSFRDRSGTSDVGPKEFRKSLLGEDELAATVRAWLSRVVWSDPSVSILIDTAPLFEGDYSELQGLIDGDWDAPFVILTGVRTDENDSEKQYQQVYGKAFLPQSFMEVIKKMNDLENRHNDELRATMSNDNFTATEKDARIQKLTSSYEKTRRKLVGNDYAQKMWHKFVTDVEGEFGFKAHFELAPLREYDRGEDITASKVAHVKPAIVPTNSKF